MSSAPSTSPKETLNRFIDGATQAIGKEIATFRREVKQERELRDAQFSARMAELGYKLESVADLERRLNERLAQLKDARVGLTVEDVEPVLRDLVSEAMAKRPSSVTLDDVRPLIESEVAAAVARVRQEHQQASAYRPQRSGWPHNLPVLDVEATPYPLMEEHVTAAVRLLPRYGEQSTR